MHLQKDLEVVDVCGIHALIIDSPKDSVVINFNDSSYYLWENLQPLESFTLDDVASLLEKEYDIDHATAVADSSELVDSWIGNGLITE